MELLICQSCGHIIRGRNKTCEGCGVGVSKHSPTVVTQGLSTGAPLSAFAQNDPLVLERTVNQIIYRGNGNGSSYSYGQTYGNGNGGNGNGGNGHENGPRLYDESDLGKIIYPATDGTEAAGLNGLESASATDYSGGYNEAPAQSPDDYKDDYNQAEDSHYGDQSAADPDEESSSNSSYQPDSADQYDSDRQAGEQNPQRYDPGQFQSGTASAGSISPMNSTMSGTPMAAGAAHARAAFAAAAGSNSNSTEDDSAQYQPPSASEFDAGTYRQVDQSEPEPQPELEQSAPAPSPFRVDPNFNSDSSARVADARPAGAPDFFSENPASQPRTDDDDFSPGHSNENGSGISHPPVAAPEHDPQTSSNAGLAAAAGVAAALAHGATPWANMNIGDAGPHVPIPNPHVAELPSAPPVAAPMVDQSATVVTEVHTRFEQRTPGGMDFFAATNAPAPSTNSSSSQSSNSQSSGEGSSSSPAEIASFMQGAQASIIQNAIQAAMNSQTQTERTFSSDSGAAQGADASAAQQAASSQGSTAKKSSKLKDKEKKKLRPKVGDAGEEAPKGKIGSKQNDPSFNKTDDSPSALSRKAEKRNVETKKADDKKSAKDRKDAKDSGKDAGQSFEIMGFPLPIKMIGIAAVLIFFVGFPIMVLLANVSSILGSLGGVMGGGAGGAAGGGAGGTQQVASSNGAPSSGLGLNGQWEFAYQNPNGSIGHGLLTLKQSGGVVEGWGVDKGQFQVRGDLKNGMLTFNKQYVENNQPKGKPILYSGKIDYANPNPPAGQPFIHVSGVWKLTKREGYSWRAQIVSLSGKWEAQLVKPAAGDGGEAPPEVAMGPNTGAGQGRGGGGGVEPPKDPRAQHDFFMKVALGIVGIGVGLAMLSLKFFGPSGLLNIWAKKEYIPSQFKQAHFKMVSEMGKTLRPGGVPLGKRDEWGIHQFWLPRELNLPPEMREQNPHTLILGAGSKGKSRLMASMITNDIESADRAVVLVDSDGALADLVMSWIAAHPKGKQLAKRVIVIDPTHDGEPICYNPLEFPEDGDLQNAASALVFGFKAVYTEPPGSQSQWNQQTANILRNSGVLLMANGKSLVDLPVLLSDNDFRDIMLEKVERMKSEKSEYTTLVEAWTNYKRLARTDQWINWIEPILNRVQPMLGDPRIRPILTKAKGDLSLTSIIREKKVLLVKIPQGQLDQNANLLGSLIVTGVKQAALSLSVHGRQKLRPCALYLDEFDTFIEKETFDAITSETRKFQIGFCGAAKTLQILPEDYRNQIIINVGIMACFALAKKDGDMLGPQMFRVDGRKVKHQTIQNVFNKVNTSPQFELISDEEKLNIDRVVGQEERTYFCYRVGTVAGVFRMRSPDFKDVPDKEINWDIVDMMYANRQSDDDVEDDDDDDEEEDDE